MHNKPREEVCDSVILPALRLAQDDHDRGVLADAKRLAVFDHIERWIEDFAQLRDVPRVPPGNPTAAAFGASVLCVAAEDQADQISAKLLAALLVEDGVKARVARPDLADEAKPDIVASLTDLSPVPGESVHVVYSSHNIEHLFAHEVPVALREFYRVLKPGCAVVIGTPDLQYVARFIAEGKLEEPLYFANGAPISPLDIVYGHGAAIALGMPIMGHRTGFTALTLHRKIADAGFRDVEVTAEKHNLRAVAYKPF